MSEVHERVPFGSPLELAKSHTLCVPGPALAKLTKGQLEEVVEAATVFARVSPQQKERNKITFKRFQVLYHNFYTRIYILYT